MHVADLLLELLSHVYFEEKTELLREQFNQRPAFQIINDGYATGCTDFAIVFCAYLKALNIKYKYIEVIQKRWLESPMDDKKVMGHALVEVNGVIVDPQRKTIYHDKAWAMTPYVVFGEAQEPYELGLVDFQTNIQKYFDFKEKYQLSKSA